MLGGRLFRLAYTLDGAAQRVGWVPVSPELGDQPLSIAVGADRAPNRFEWVLPTSVRMP